MPEYPTGVVTLVFTDIEGSSALWESYREAFAPVLEKHNHLMRSAAAHCNGVEVKTEGDAFFLVFAQADDAVRFSVEIQLALQAFDWPALLEGIQELRVRIGMHSGEPILAAHPGGVIDYFGPVVNRAARVGAAGYGGQVLVSEATRTLALGGLDGSIGFEDLGRHRLKGVGEETLYQITHADLPSRFPPLKTLAGARHNLPPSATPFIGRETEVANWSVLLQQPATRLLTLCAFGGQGKTRLALQIAENVVDDYADGVWWVEVEAARDAEAMIARIAHELRLHLQPQPSVREQVFDFCRERELLLVLDNTEQIPDAGPVLGALLAAAPKLKCLVTTRRALQIRAERVVNVPPLPVADATTLFVERATSRVPDFVLDEDNREAIEKLCLALEGVPLAIELAASRLTVLSPSEILERLDERFRLLQTKAPDLPPRQRALRGAIDWSYELLTDEEKVLLGVLSVFAGGFNLEAAETVSDDFEALDGVAELARHSLLRSEEQRGAKRFAMLVSVRAYAAEKLDASPDAEEIRRRHATYFLKFAETNTKKLRTRGEAKALEEFWLERANLAAALEWASEQGDVDLTSKLVLAIYDGLYRLGFWEEAREAVVKGWVAIEGQPGGVEAFSAKTRSALQLRLASLAHDRGEIPEAQQRAQLALELARQVGAINEEANSLNLLGLLSIDTRQLEEARSFFEASLAKRAANDENGRAIALTNLALLRSHQGDQEGARALNEEALKHRRMAGDIRGEAETLGNLGVLFHNAGQLDDARRLYTQSLALRRELRDRLGIALMLHNLGEIAVAEGDTERAVIFFVHGERTFREIGSAFASASAGFLKELENQLGPDFTPLFQRAQNSSWEERVPMLHNS